MARYRLTILLATIGLVVAGCTSATSGTPTAATDIEPAMPSAQAEEAAGDSSTAPTTSAGADEQPTSETGQPSQQDAAPSRTVDGSAAADRDAIEAPDIGQPPSGTPSFGTPAAPPTGANVPGTAAPEFSDETEIVYIDPFGNAGKLKAGFTKVTNDPPKAFGCAQPSPVAVADDILLCSPDALGAHVCWPGDAPDEVLCLYDPTSTELHRVVNHQPVEPVTAPADPWPWLIELAEGQQCHPIEGGGWGYRTDGFWPAYFCDEPDFVLMTDDQISPVDRSEPLWTVQVGELDMGENASLPPPTTRPVSRVYFAGSPG